MRKLLCSLTLTALLILGLAPVAQAMPVGGPKAQYGNRCMDFLSGLRSNRYCVTLNTRDILLGRQVEALVFSNNDLTSGAFQVDWIHLYRDGVVQKKAGPTGWMSGSNTSFSTDWYGLCGQGDHQYRAVVRMRYRRDGVTSAYKKWDSDVHTFGCV